MPEWARDRPDRCLVASDEPGRWELFSWDAAGGERTQITDRPAGTTFGVLDPAAEWVWWFGDEDGSEFGRWMRQPFGSKPGQATALDLPPAYSAGLALGMDFAVVASTTDSGTAVHVVRHPLDHLLVYAHREQAWLGELSRDERLVCIAHSEHGDSIHPALLVLDLEGDRVGELWDGPGRGLHPGPWSPVPGDQRMLVGHERADRDRFGIWTPAGGAFQDFPLPALPGDATATWYPDGSALLVVHRSGGRATLHRLDLRDGSMRAIGTEPGSIHEAAARPDGSVWFEWSSGSQPPEVRSGTSPLLVPAGEPAPPGCPYRDVRVGQVHALVAEPAGPPPHPGIFLIHGGPAAQDADAFSPKAQAWVDHGFAVVHVNYRGSSGYGRAWRDALIGNPGFTELADVHAVRERLVADRVVDPERLVLAGRSWGGYLTLLGAGVRPDLWSLGIAEAPVADYVAAYEDEMEPLKALDRDLFGGTPAEIPEAYRERSPLTYAEQVRAPLFITGGVNDPRCPIRQIERYVSRLESRGKRVEFLRYPAGHRSNVIEEQIRQLELQIAFAARHLGTRMPM